MASILPSSVVGDIAGTINDQTYARNHAGLFVRERVDPHQWHTADQVLCEVALAQVSSAWSGTLTEPQREGWRDYARQHPRPNWRGCPTVDEGQLAFVRHNCNRYRTDTALRFPDCPSEAPLHRPGFGITASAGAQTVTATFPTTTYWPYFDGLELWLFVGKQVNVGRAYFSSPFKLAGTNLYTDSWALDPFTVAYPSFPDPMPAGDDILLVQGKRIFARMFAQQYYNGAMSTKHQATCVVGP